MEISNQLMTEGFNKWQTIPYSNTKSRLGDMVRVGNRQILVKGSSSLVEGVFIESTLYNLWL